GRVRAPSAPSPAQMGTRTPQWSRPLVDQRSADPGTGANAQPLPAASPSSGALPGAAYATGGPLSAPTSRPSALPADFRNIFAETEYMLWSREETDKLETVKMPRTPAEPPPPASEPPGRMERAGASANLVPPVLREQGFNLE